MRKYVILAILLTASAFAQTTPNIGLQLPNYNSSNWGVSLNYNFSRLDGFLGGTLPLFWQSGSGAPSGGCPYTTTGSLAIGSPTLNVISSANFQAGQTVVATGVPTGTKIISVSGNVVTLSANATASESSETISAYPYGEPYTDIVGNTQYVCSAVGWVSLGGSGTYIPPGTANQLLYYATPGTSLTPLNLGTDLSISGGTLNVGVGSGTVGYIPSFSTSTTIADSHLDDGVTTAGTITSTEPLAGASATFSGAVTAQSVNAAGNITATSFTGPLTGLASQNLPLAGGTMSNNAAIAFQGTGAATTLSNLSGVSSVSSSPQTVPILNGMVNANSSYFTGADACAKIRAANLYAIANGIPNVDARGFTGTQVCTSGTDIWGNLAASNANINLVDWLGSVRIETTTPFTITNPGLSVIGAGAPNTWIEYTGTGVASAVVSVGSATPSSVYVQNVRMSGLLLFGDTGNATDGLFLTGVHHSIFSDILTWGVTGCGIHTEFAVTNTFIAPRTSGNDAAQFGIASGHSQPTSGLCFGEIDSSHKTTNSTVIDAAAEGVSGVGWLISGANNMLFAAGTSENNGGDGTQINAGNVGNQFIAVDLESNTGTDNLLDNGQQTIIQSPVMDSKPIELGASSTGFQLVGGNLTAPITVDAGASNYGYNYGSNHEWFQISGALVNNTGMLSVAATGCAITAGAIGNQCTATVNLGLTEPDVNYKVVGCMINGGTGVNTIGNINGINTTAFTVEEVALSNTATGGGTIQCMVVHN